ncbi:MAG TPA: radical SAM protein [Kofleriaceae bacterium]|jgi:radical SAM protein with 4Fe4S-binding SPASM domain|nr:radical SAM protein [Kofleriaceae bacterium]
MNRDPKRVSLPVLNGERDLPRPVFGSPEVAPYGAVGLEVTLAAPAPAPASMITSTLGADGKSTYQISRVEPLPLVESIAHHKVDNDHLWLGVADGLVLVLDDDEHKLMKQFAAEASPQDVAERAEKLLAFDKPTAWKATAGLIGRLSAAGFIRGIQGYHSVKKIRPYAFARFHLTNRCQLECVHCYTASSPHLPDDNELTTERWIQLVDEFADNGGQRILFTGGEALVHRGCVQIMERAKARKLEVTLFSNGILIPRYLDAIKACVDIVQISIDGPTAESHDQVRGEGSFKKATRALRLLLDAKISTRVSTTLMAGNWEAFKSEFPNFVAQFEGSELGYRISYGAMAHGRGENIDQSLDTDQTRAHVDKILSRVKTTENRAEGPNAIQKISGCGYAEQLVIAADGLVYPCHLLSGALGHVDDLPVAKITKYLERTAAAFSVDNRTGCGTCDLRHLCGGSCRVEDEKHTGSRLITTCTPEEKLRKKRFLASRYRPIADTPKVPQPTE